jgi:hypothetical protein
MYLTPPLCPAGSGLAELHPRWKGGQARSALFVKGQVCRWSPRAKRRRLIIGA